MALFSAGLKLDRPLTFRDWSSVARLLLLAMPLTIGAVALLGGALLGLSAAGRAAARRRARADRPGARRRHRRRPARRRGRARAELRADRRGRAQRRARRAVRARRRVRRRAGRQRLGLGVAGRRRRLRDRDRARDRRRGRARSPPGASSGCAAASMLVADVRRLPRDRHRARDLRRSSSWPPATASSACSPAGSRSAATSTTTSSTRRVHEGAERIEKLLELAGDPAARLDAHARRARRARLGGLAARRAAARRSCARSRACVALVGSRMDHPEEKAFVAWFGVRGVGTLYYLAVIVGAGALAGGEQELVVWTCIAAVLVSIVVHGITAGPSLRRLLLRQRPAPRAAESASLGDEVEHRRLQRRLVDRQLARLDLRGDALERRADRQPARRTRRTRAGRCRRRGRPPACCRGSCATSSIARLTARLRAVLRRRRLAGHGERDRGQRGRVPGAEVLGGEVAAGGLLEVRVDVGRADVVPAPALLVGEQLVPAAAPPLERGDDRARRARPGSPGGGAGRSWRGSRTPSRRRARPRRAPCAASRGRRTRSRPRTPRSRCGRTRARAAAPRPRARSARSERGAVAQVAARPGGAASAAHGRSATMSSNFSLSRRVRQASW